MPIININNCNYHYEIHGSGEDFLVFSHGLLWNGSIFQKQIEYFQSKYSILIYDQCGHGQSEVLIMTLNQGVYIKILFNYWII